MAVDVKIPEIGESISEGFLAEWSVPDGSIVEADQPLLVLETDKITMNVTADAAGRLEVLVGEGETVQVGQVVARIDTDAEGEAPAAAKAEAEEAEPAETPPEKETRPERREQQPAEKEADAPPADLSRLTPAVRRLVEEHDLDPSAIPGSGKDGRILKGDVISFLDRRPAAAPKPAPTPTVVPPSTPRTGPQPAAEPGERQTRRPMSRLRQRLAERLVEVQQTSAMLTTFNEVDMSRVMALRSSYKETFKERHGVGLGFMSFFVKAAVDALKTVPEVNAAIDGDQVVTNHYYDIGIAVSTDHGLVVPVVREADRLSMAEIEARIAELAAKAQERSLQLTDLQGAVFTISNGGVFGSLMSTPILNPPGSAILGMHTIQKRPVVVDDEIVIRPMMYLALSYDHRIVDGRESVTFLKRIVDCIADPDRMLLEI
jgi:2-oxoglutarate dehydrogenase E2 component (dihydrolipoamide succinyltransferase)